MGSAFLNYMQGNGPVDPLAIPDEPTPEPSVWDRDYWSLSYIDRAILRVYEYVSQRLEKTDNFSFNKDDVYVVWFNFQLGGWKAMLSTALPDGMYYEVTYNKDKRETYVDAYKKFDNICLPDAEEMP